MLCIYWLIPDFYFSPHLNFKFLWSIALRPSTDTSNKQTNGRVSLSVCILDGVGQYQNTSDWNLKNTHDRIFFYELSGIQKTVYVSHRLCTTEGPYTCCAITRVLACRSLAWWKRWVTDRAWGGAWRWQWVIRPMGRRPPYADRQCRVHDAFPTEIWLAAKISSALDHTTSGWTVRVSRGPFSRLHGGPEK